MKLTKNQQDIVDHTKKNGWFALDANGQDYNDCEFLYAQGLFTRTDAADWVGDDYIYRIKESGQ